MSASSPVIFITGASRGIGRAIAYRAAEAGHRVAFTFGSDRAAAEETRQGVAARGADAFVAQADVSRRDDIGKAVAGAFAAFGRIDGLVNNAGIIGAQRSILTADEAHLDAVFRTNVHSIFYSIAEVTPLMSTQHGGQGGAIVNVSSAAARHGGMPNEAHYAASKGAVDSLTIALAKELPPHGIRINAIRPGLIRTAIHEAHGGEETIRRVAPTIPLGRAGEASEVADVVMFLLGPGSTYVNGALIDVSGGR
jgi:NAD(P)-dependent dehydrogenase (short-subunit alcohol dehydrogenase family)